MTPDKSSWIRVASIALLAGLFCVCVYRAVTQSITYDEALTWQLYILGPAKNIFQHFDANHHFLNTVLMRLSTAVFGVSEWSLRLPALGGAALYFTAVYRLSRAAFPDGLSSLLAVALLSLNPFVLDFMVAARGYGLGLALLMWGLTLLYEAVSRAAFEPRRLMLAGAAIALSVTANLIFAPPALGLAGIGVYLLMLHRPETPKKRAAKPSIAHWIWFTAPIGVLAVAYLLMAPVENMKADQFYVGTTSIVESLRSMASVSLEHSGSLRGQAWSDVWRDIVAFGIAPAIVVLGIVMMRKNPLLMLTAGTIAISAVVLLLIHVAMGSPYPADRTGIYFLPLVGLVLIGLAGGASRVAVYAIAILFVAQFATEFNTRKFLVWEYDADTRAIGETIARGRGTGTQVTRIGGSWHLQEALTFYGYQNHWDWMELTNAAPAAGLDFYAFVPWERDYVGKLGLTEVFRGSVSGSVVARGR